MCAKKAAAKKSAVKSSSEIEITRVLIGLEGLPPGLMFQGKGLMAADAIKKGPRKPGDHRPPEEEAKLRAHWMPDDKTLCIPTVMLYRSICAAANEFKDPINKRKGFGYTCGSTVAFEEDRWSLGKAKYIVDVDWVRIPPKTGAMVQIGRPFIKVWACEGILLVDAELYEPVILKDVIAQAGRRVGIGADRPGLKGAKGKFRLTKFEVLN
jgi:hypothetical protein